MRRKGAEEARNRSPELLDAAEKGRSTIITRPAILAGNSVDIQNIASNRDLDQLLAKCHGERRRRYHLTENGRDEGLARPGARGSERV